VASLVGFDRFVKMWWQVFVSPFFIVFHFALSYMNYNSYELMFI
jgi:hypothetical protein